MKYFRVIIVVAITAVLIILTGCTDWNDKFTNVEGETLQMKKGYENISPEEAKKRLDAEKGIVLLDVRTKEEYEEKHIPGSKLIPVDVLEKEAQSNLSDKNATIFVYCRSGRRSITAAEILVEQGYTKVFNLGGIIDWPYETE